MPSSHAKMAAILSAAAGCSVAARDGTAVPGGRVAAAGLPIDALSGGIGCWLAECVSDALANGPATRGAALAIGWLSAPEANTVILPSRSIRTASSAPSKLKLSARMCPLSRLKPETRISAFGALATAEIFLDRGDQPGTESVELNGPAREPPPQSGAAKGQQADHCGGADGQT